MNGYSAGHSGVAVYGAEAAVRLIDPAPNQNFVTHALHLSSAERPLWQADPGRNFSGGVISERTYYIGSRAGTLSIAQNLGPNDTNIHDTGKNITVSLHANTNMVSQSVSAPVFAALDQRNRLGENLGEDWFSGGSVGINANSHPLAAGLFVTDVPAGKTDYRGVFNLSSFRGYGTDPLTLPGAYPTNVIFGARALSQANGAFKAISVVSGTTSNNTSEAFVTGGSSNIMKRVEGLRRYSEGYIPGAVTKPGAATEADWRTVAWHDGISVDDSFSIPAPAIGSEYMGSDASDLLWSGQGIETSRGFVAQNATKVWWERRPNNIDNNDDPNRGPYQNQEYTESHLFGSSNNHVMTVHANTSYQGVHVEKGGIYADNSILAWARILPRGINQNPLISADTASGIAPRRQPNVALPNAAAVVNESHNIDSFTQIGVGLFKLVLNPKFQNQNNYSVIVSGTNNLFLGQNPPFEVSPGINTGMTAAEIDAYTFRRSEATNISDTAPNASDVRSNAQDPYGDRRGGMNYHSVRVANSSVIIVESRVAFSYQAQQAMSARIDEDEVYVAVIGAVDPTKYRG